MKILVTETVSSSFRAHLANSNDVRGSDGLDVREPDQVKPLLEGVEALVHAVPTVAKDQSEEETLDRATRGAYVLLQEAIEAGVPRAILLTPLDAFDAYDADYVIDEAWRARPGPEAGSLAPVLAERVFREFSRQGPISTTSLRSRTICSVDPSEVDRRAIDTVLKADDGGSEYRYQVYNVDDSVRFPLRAARSLLKGVG